MRPNYKISLEFIWKLLAHTAFALHGYHTIGHKPHIGSSSYVLINLAIWFSRMASKRYDYTYIRISTAWNGENECHHIGYWKTFMTRFPFHHSEQWNYLLFFYVYTEKEGKKITSPSVLSQRHSHGRFYVWKSKWNKIATLINDKIDRNWSINQILPTQCTITICALENVRGKMETILGVGNIAHSNTGRLEMCVCDLQ